MRKSIIYVSLLFAVSFFLNAQKITILHFNDTHSCVEEMAPRNENLVGKYGGLARFASVLGYEHMQDQEAILLNPGDFFIGDLFFNKYYGGQEMALIHSIWDDEDRIAFGLGNHEFDLSPDFLNTVLTTTRSNYPFKVLASNLVDTLQKLNGIEPYTIFTSNGIKVGVFGFVSPKTEDMSMPGSVDILDTKEYNIDSLTAIIRSSGAKVVVMMSGLGLKADMELAARSRGLDIIIGGDDHLVMEDTIVVKNPEGKNVYIAQAGPFYKNLGKFEIFYNNRIDSVKWTNFSIDENVPYEPTVKYVLDSLELELEKSFGHVYDEQYTRATGTFTEAMTVADIMSPGSKNTPAGCLITKAFHASFPEADAAMHPNGFISMPIYEGPVTRADVYRMLGYGFNTENGLGFRLAKSQITGAQIWYGIEVALNGSILGNHDEYFVQADGLEYHYDVRGGQGKMVQWIKIKGEPIDLTKVYTIVTNEIVPSMLDKLMEKTGLPFRVISTEVQSLTEYESVLNYIKDKESIVPETCSGITDTGEEIEHGLNIEVYPNPAKDFVIIKNPTNDFQNIKVVDQAGVTIQNFNVPAGLEFNLDVSCLPAGVYYVTSSSSKSSVRFIKY